MSMHYHDWLKTPLALILLQESALGLDFVKGWGKDFFLFWEDHGASSPSPALFMLGNKDYVVSWGQVWVCFLCTNLFPWNLCLALHTWWNPHGWQHLRTKKHSPTKCWETALPKLKKNRPKSIQMKAPQAVLNQKQQPSRPLNFGTKTKRYMQLLNESPTHLKQRNQSPVG